MADVAAQGQTAPRLTPEEPLEERVAAARERHALHQAEGKPHMHSAMSVQAFSLPQANASTTVHTPSCDPKVTEATQCCSSQL